MYLKRLKDLREDNDLTQEIIANLLKITRPQYSLYETGKRDIPVDLLRKLGNTNPHQKGRKYIFYSIVPDKPLDNKYFTKYLRLELKELGIPFRK